MDLGFKAVFVNYIFFLRRGVTKDQITTEGMSASPSFSHWFKSVR